MKRILLLLGILFLVSGCYDYQELSDMSIVDAIGIDYKNEMYEVSFEIIKSVKDGDSAILSTEIVTASDKVLAKAFNKTIQMAGKKVSLKHVKLLLLSKDLAIYGINPVVDYIIRDVSISPNLYTLICDNPKDIFNVKVEDNTIGKVIVDTITYNVEAKSLDNIDIIASNIINKKVDIALPFITLNNKNVVANKIAYFNNSNFVDLIDSKMYNFLYLDSSNIDFNKDNTVLNIYDKKINYIVNKNEIIIYIEGKAKVKEVDKKYNLKDVNVYNKIENEINEVIKDETNNFLEETLSNEADLLGLEDKYYKMYKVDKKRIKYQVKTNIKINRNGAIYEVLND